MSEIEAALWEGGAEGPPFDRPASVGREARQDGPVPPVGAAREP